jgi:LysM repeat protein
MGSVRRSNLRGFLPYLGLNVLVSAATVLIVLAVWDRGPSGSAEQATPTIDVVGQVDETLPTVTPSRVPSPTPVTYTVRAGDTLLAIATDFGISVDALMEANRLKDPNALAAGQLLVIPGDALPASASTPEAVEGDGAPDDGGSPPAIVINGVEGAGEFEIESVRLLNSGGEVTMADWTLEDDEGHVFRFPVFTFYSTGAVDVHTRGGTNTSIDLYWGLDEPVWTSGKIIYLKNAAGEVLSTFSIP